MRIIKPYTELLDNDIYGLAVLKKIEKAGRICYKSEELITDDSAPKFVAGLIKSGHEAMLEHYSFSVKFVCDRGVSHELVRHRIASFAQESTRYANYSKGKFNEEITVIEPCFFAQGTPEYSSWKKACETAEKEYLYITKTLGKPAQEARSVLPNSLKTEIIVTANLREWRHFFKLRALGTTGRPHPQMLELTLPLLEGVKKMYPVIFDDLVTK